MTNIYIADVDSEDENGLILTFSDGTFAEYPLCELLELRPNRLSTEGSPVQFAAANEQF
jgi:hypothetical protein